MEKRGGHRTIILALTLISISILLSSTASAFSLSDLLDQLSRIINSILNPGEQGGSTGEETVVCTQPYIRVGRECCLDQNDNQICDRDEATETTTATTPTTQPTQQTTSTIKRHLDCENGMCVQKEGEGADECQADGDCKHMRCDNGYCVQTNGPGEDECLIDNQCRHKVCNETNYCVEVMSKGVSQCQTTSECTTSPLRHKACRMLGMITKCTSVDGAGPDRGGGGDEAG